MALSGKNIRQLRSLAHHLNPIIHIGKSDITDSLVKETEAALEAREAANLLAERTNAEVVQVIGHRFAIYRESSRDDIDKIVLQ